MTERNRFVLAVATVALLLLAACTISTNDEPVELSSDRFQDLLTTTTTTTPTSAPVTRDVELFFVRNVDGATTVEPVIREVDVDATVPAVLNDLFTTSLDEDDPAEGSLSSSIPESAVLLSATITPGTENLVVDVQGLFGEGGITGNPLRNALAQIVFTATVNSEDVRTVSFQNDGTRVPAVVGSGETKDEPVDRSDYRELT